MLIIYAPGDAPDALILSSISCKKKELLTLSLTFTIGQLSGAPPGTLCASAFVQLTYFAANQPLLLEN
jgi:hypothetical protein